MLTFSPCGRHLPLETAGLETENGQHFPESNPSVCVSSSGHPPGTAVALSLVNEAQYLLVNTSSVLELQQQLNARLDPFPEAREQGELFAPGGGGWYPPGKERPGR